LDKNSNPEHQHETIGDRIRYLRTLLHLKIHEFAKILDIKLPNTYARYEAGLRVPNIETLEKIAEYSHTTVIFLQTGFIEKKLCKAIKKLRVHLGKTIEEFSGEIEITTDFLKAIEDNKISPSNSFFVYAGKKYGITPHAEALYGYEDETRGYLRSLAPVNEIEFVEDDNSEAPGNVDFDHSESKIRYYIGQITQLTSLLNDKSIEIAQLLEENRTLKNEIRRLKQEN
jgi:transcriptional regulator with XRE-family HTH domain